MSMLKKGMYAAQFPVGDGDPHWSKVVSLLRYISEPAEEEEEI